MSELAQDSDWAEVDDEGTDLVSDETTEATTPEELTSTEKNVVRDLASHNIDLKEVGTDFLTFSAHPNWDEGSHFGTNLPRERAADLLSQLQHGAFLCKRWAGIAIPNSGYIEVLIRPNSSIMPSSSMVRAFMHSVSEDVDATCRHASGAEPFLSLQDLNTSREKAPRLHLSDDSACVEISGPSPACHVLANSGYRARSRFFVSLKVEFGHPMKQEDLEATAEPILNSLVYELEVRNGIKSRLVRWPPKYDRRQLIRRERGSRVVRFPQTRIDPEVSVLFGFAGSATGNPPLAFLSYYQVLENFFPVATRRSALRKLELELSDQRFDRHQDKYLMRILAVGENAASSSESAQLRVLLEEFVRGGSLQDFFTERDWGKHFTKNGPIRGITDSINPDNRQVSLSQQVADRVYKIRNRIVHAKDDPKYDSVPALLPQSDEAESLWPDIELVRLLAFEVILSTQTRIRNG
ncbi:hypothetical protein FSY75_34220 [Streptomyces sp. TR1341]|uniref:hypothetical protein n=1 Tax=Streptomyces sp. TR1341 TaxID=2601266 RepID=UPI00138AB840|nr:hypothetical protein [Streptomyces sp. TR1341]